MTPDQRDALQAAIILLNAALTWDGQPHPVLGDDTSSTLVKEAEYRIRAAFPHLHDRS